MEEIGSLNELYSFAISAALEEQRQYLLEAIDYGFVAKEDLLCTLKENDLNLKIDECSYGELVAATNKINHTLTDNTLEFGIYLSSGERNYSDDYLRSIIEKVNKIMKK